jgi:gentisate 1,2-dioxygenase
MSEPQFTDVEELNGFLAERNMHGFWNASREPEEVQPHLWHWPDIARGLMSAGSMVEINNRTIQLDNPGLRSGMTKTLHLSVHLLNPRERQKGHRNNVVETRFVVKAPPGFTFIIDGEPFPVEEGDLVTTPNYSWHDHKNPSETEPAIWIDCMDTELVNVIGPRLGDRIPGDYQDIIRPAGYSAKTLRPARSRSAGDRGLQTPFRYRWADTYETLMAMKEQEDGWDPYNGIHLVYTHPLTGGPTCETFSAEVRLLTPGARTQSHRENCTTLYQAFRGSGRTQVAGRTFEWSQGDIFVVPSWATHRHENAASEDAILFSITDRPAAEALGLYREERDGE